MMPPTVLIAVTRWTLAGIIVLTVARGGRQNELLSTALIPLLMLPEYNDTPVAEGLEDLADGGGGKRVIHWAFLILAFIAGFASCYGIIYQLVKVYSQLVGAIDEACKYFGGHI